MTIPPVMDDIGEMLAFIDERSEVKRSAVGCHGYCMSGPYALAAAARYPEQCRSGDLFIAITSFAWNAAGAARCSSGISLPAMDRAWSSIGAMDPHP
jgi:dienelactone hydrolase